MPRLVQVTTEQAQILEEDTTKAHDPDSGDRNLEEITLKAHDPNSNDRDLEETAMKSCNPNSTYCQRHEHEGARVLTIVHLFFETVIMRKIIGIARKTIAAIWKKIAVKS